MTQMNPLHTARQVTLIGAGVNVLLSIGKLVIGKVTQSHALIADGVHSLSDLLTDIFVLFTTHYGQQAADAEHPYGHRRIETVGSIIIAILMILAAAGIMYDAIIHVTSGALIQAPGILALVMAGISVVANEWLFRITQRAGQQLHLPILVSNAWHHRSDAASSLVVVVGLVGALFGWYFLDALAAIVVSLMIFHMGFKLIWSGLLELIDTSVEPAVLACIRNIISAVPGVRECHQLRTRMMGGKIAIDVHVIVEPTISVSEGHHIGEQVTNELLKKIEHILDVIVHIDPEDDEVSPSCDHLPLRGALVQSIQEKLRQIDPSVVADRFHFHYLSGKIYLDLGLPMTAFFDVATMKSYQMQASTLLQSINEIAEVNVFFY